MTAHMVQGFGVSSVLRQAWGAVGSLTERLADVAYDYVPDSVARSTVCSLSHIASYVTHKWHIGMLCETCASSARSCMSGQAGVEKFSCLPSPCDGMRCWKLCSCQRLKEVEERFLDLSLQVVLAVRAAFVLLLVGFARSILGVSKHSTAVTSSVLTA
jgi:hypothetical protein